MTKKILIIVFSVLVVGVFAFLLTWGIINWSKVKEGMAGSGLYTQSDIQNAYEDGYNAALADKDEYDDLINEYRDTITTLTDNISQLNSEISALKRENSSLELEITNLTLIRDKLETQVEELFAGAEDNEAIIEDLNRQILALNTKIENLTFQLQNHNAVVSTLNKTIADLQASIEYYEQYIASLENDQTVVVTFEFDGKVYSIQVIAKGATATVADPPSTEGVIFNGWTVNGKPVNLAEYPVNENTKFVADVSYKYVVSFSVDGVVKSTQLVDKGQYAEPPTSPKKANYTFKYWTLDGDLEVELEKYPITCDTTFIAKFARLYTVSFQYENGTEIVSRRIEEGTTTTPARITDLAENAVFNGWKHSGVLVDVANYIINQDTIFVADITYFYAVRFMADGAQFGDTLYIESGKCVDIVDIPEKSGYKLVGWSVNNSDIDDITQYKILQDTVFVAKFELKTLDECSWAEIAEISESGQAKERFKLGETKTMHYTNNGAELTATVAIIGFDHDTISGTQKKAGITFATLEIITSAVMNSTAVNDGGWAESKMRTDTMAKLYEMLEEDLQSAIKSVDKVTNNGYKNGNANITTSDKLWLFSETETNHNTNFNDGTPYEYFVNNDIRTLISHPSILYGNFDIWLRTSSSSNSRQFWYFGTASGILSGDRSSDEATKKYNVIFGFCI